MGSDGNTNKGSFVKEHFEKLCSVTGSSLLGIYLFMWHMKETDFVCNAEWDNGAY